MGQETLGARVHRIQQGDIALEMTVTREMPDKELLEAMTPFIDGFDKWVSRQNRGGPLMRSERELMRVFLVWAAKGFSE